MLNFLKSLFSSPKAIVAQAVDALDMLVPILAIKMDQIRQKFALMDSTEKSQWLIDEVQAFLRRHFGLPEPK